MSRDPTARIGTRTRATGRRTIARDASTRGRDRESAERLARGGATTEGATESVSGLRISNRTVSGAVVRQRFSERRTMTAREVATASSESFVSGKHGFVGVVCEAKRRIGNDGRAYGTWRVSDLGSGGGEVTVNVFGDAFDAHHPERDDARGSGGVVGMIWAVFDAAWYKRGHVSTREAGQLMKIGAATDFALCKAKRRDGQPCTKAVNASVCAFCEFHVPKAIREVASAQRAMTGKRNANDDFKASLQKHGAAMNKAAATGQSHMTQPGQGAMFGAPPPSARARDILTRTGGALPRQPFTSKRSGATGPSLGDKRAKTVSLDDEDLEFEDDEATLKILAKQHASSIAQARKDADLAKQRAAAERLKATGLTLAKPDPNDTSAKKPTPGTIRADPKPLPDALKTHGLQTNTMAQLEKKLKAETTRRMELERENAELRRQLAEAHGEKPSSDRVVMGDMSNRNSKSFGNENKAPVLKSRYDDDAREEDVDTMMTRMDALQERDQLAAQLALKRETNVKVYHCSQCQKKTRFFDSSTCAGHRSCVTQIESIMRYFKCKGCNQTNTTFDALMPKACERNGCSSIVFERVTAADVTAAAKPRKDEMTAGELASREALAPRGVEHGFRLDTIHGAS